MKSTLRSSRFFPWVNVAPDDGVSCELMGCQEEPRYPSKLCRRHDAMWNLSEEFEECRVLTIRSSDAGAAFKKSSELYSRARSIYKGWLLQFVSDDGVSV